jgi:tetratricopeptide (TPR) repeat protein
MTLAAAVLGAIGMITWFALRAPDPAKAARATLEPGALKQAHADIEKSLKENDLARAKALAEKLTIEQPDDARAFALLGQAHLALLDRPAAYAAAARSLELNGGDHEVHFFAGTIASQLRDHSKARHHYTQAMMLSPSTAKYPMYLGELLMKLNDLDGAQIQLLRAASLDSAQPQIHSMLAGIAARRGKPKMAIELADRAIDTAGEPKKKLPYQIQKAQLLRADNEPGAALALLLSLPEDARWQMTVIEQIAQTHLMMNAPEKAGHAWAEALERDPTNVRASAEAGLCFFRAGDQKSARQYLNIARRIDPNHFTVRALAELVEPREGK